MKQNNIMKQQQKDYYLIAVFTTSKEFKNREIIASIQYRCNFFDNLDWNKIKNYNNFLRSDKTLEILHIFKDPLNEILEPINNTVYQTINLKNEKLETIEYNKIPDHYFFNDHYINEIFFKDFSPDFNISTKLFCFEDFQWKILVNRFKDLNINLSGGSTTKRHVLSPVQMKLAIFLQILDGFQDSINKSRESFNLANLIQKTNAIEMFSKNELIWEIRNILKDLYKDKHKHIEIDIRLFLLNRINPNYILNISTELKQKNENKIEEICLDILNKSFDKSELIDNKKVKSFLNTLKNCDSKYHS
jgi:hypothetical protein